MSGNSKLRGKWMSITSRATAVALTLTMAAVGTIFPAHAAEHSVVFSAEKANSVEVFVITPDLLMDSRQKAASMSPEQVEEIHSYMGPNAVATLESAIQRNGVSNDSEVAPAAIPAVIAGVAIGAVAWCASGALSSVPTSVLTDMINRGEGGGSYVQNAIVGCIAGNVGGAVWKLIPHGVKQSIYSAVVKFYWNYIR